MLRALLLSSAVCVAFVFGRLSVKPERVINCPPDVQCVERVENVQFFTGDETYTAPRVRIRFTNGEVVWARATAEFAHRYEMGDRLVTHYPYLKTLLENDK